jgi:hypothetical protein
MSKPDVVESRIRNFPKKRADAMREQYSKLTQHSPTTDDRAEKRRDEVRRAVPLLFVRTPYA